MSKTSNKAKFVCIDLWRKEQIKLGHIKPKKYSSKKKKDDES